MARNFSTRSVATKEAQLLLLLPLLMLPRLLQLTYLGSGEVLRFQPDPEDLEAFEGKLRALWASMVAVMQSEGWTPRPGPLCRWCSFAPVCPAQGGEALPLPAHARAGGTSGQVR